MLSSRIARQAARTGFLLLTIGAAPAAAQSAPAEPNRVISLIPSVTDLILALGAGDRLIARTAYDHDPRVADLPSVGGMIDPSVERIVALLPDLVFVWPEASFPLRSRLIGFGIRSEVMGTETLAELRANLGRIGRLFRVERQADSLRRAIDDSLAAVHASIAGRAPVRVLYLLATNPPIVAGAGSFLDDLVAAAGGQNVFADAVGRWPSVSLEAVLQRDPDLIVWPRPPGAPDAAEALRQLPGWARLKAVRHRRVLAVNRDLFDRPGPRIAEAARTLAAGFFRPDSLVRSGRLRSPHDH